MAGLDGRVAFALQAGVGGGPLAPGDQLIAAGQLAETYGLDAFFLGDHPAWAPECWLHLAVLAKATGRLRLGPLVAAAPYRAPLLTARLASDLDHLSGGRCILGLGIGWNAADYGQGANEFDRMGLPYPPARERQAALEEQVAIIRGAWGPDPLTFHGSHYQATEAAVTPPVQRPGPPLVIAGAGERTLRQVARLADACNFGPGPAGGVDTPAQAREKLALLGRCCGEVGRPIEDILPSHFTHRLILAADESALEAKVRRAFPRGLDDFWGRYLVARTPAGAVAYFQAFADAGIRYFVAQILDPQDEETVRLLAHEVAPRVRLPASSPAA